MPDTGPGQRDSAVRGLFLWTPGSLTLCRTPLRLISARLLLDSLPALFQQVFAQIHGLLERVAIFAKFNSHVESLPNECRISVIFNGFRELSVVEGVCAVPCREEWLSRAEIRIVVGIKKVPFGEYLNLLRLSNFLLFTVVDGALNLPNAC